MVGFTLMEIVVCIFITTLGLCGLMGAVAHAMHVNGQVFIHEGV